MELISPILIMQQPSHAETLGEVLPLARDVYDEKRNRLALERTEVLLFIKSNY